MATDNIASTSTDTSTSGLTGEKKGNVYDTAETKDYTNAIQNMYDQSTADTQASIQDTVDTGTANLNKIQSLGEGAYSQQYQAAQNDYNDAINTREGIEANNGNRDGIGHSQYGQPEQTLAYQRAAIAANIQQLKTDTTRQISDLRAQGDYQAADAALSNMQAKLKQMYTDSLKQDTNLYQSYTYEYGLQREDAQEQAEQAETDKAFLRTLGTEFLQMGLMPSQAMLDAMGLTAEEAENYRAYYGGTYSGSGSSGSSSGSSSSSSSLTSSTTDTSGSKENPSVYKYNASGYSSVTDTTQMIYADIANGDTESALAKVKGAEYSGVIDTGYGDILESTIKSGGKNSAGYQNYLRSLKS